MRATLGGRLAVAVGIVAVVLATAAGAHAATQTRYSLVHGCYALTPAGPLVPGAEPRAHAGHRARAATCSTRPTARSSPRRPAAASASTPRPSPAADWRVDAASDGTVHAHAAAGGATLRDVALHARPTGCADYPEAELDATGTPSQGRHQLRPRRRPGRGPHALDDLRVPRRRLPLRQARGTRTASRTRCPTAPRSRARRARAAPMQNFLNYGNPVAAARHHRLADSSTRGAPSNLTYEGTYWRWIQRAWMAGLRLMVMSVNENRDPLRAAGQPRDQLRRDGHRPPRPRRTSTSSRTTSTRRPAGRARGSSRSSPTPYQARRVINEGKMAVVLEVEVSEPFDCSRLRTSRRCDQAQVDARARRAVPPRRALDRCC